MASFEQRELKSEILFSKLWCGSSSDGDGMVKVKSNGKIMQLLKKKLFMLKMVALVLFSCLSFCFFFLSRFLFGFFILFYLFSLNYNFAILAQLSPIELTELDICLVRGA